MSQIKPNILLKQLPKHRALPRSTQPKSLTSLVIKVPRLTTSKVTIPPIGNNLGPKTYQTPLLAEIGTFKERHESTTKVNNQQLETFKERHESTTKANNQQLESSVNYILALIRQIPFHFIASEIQAVALNHRYSGLAQGSEAFIGFNCCGGNEVIATGWIESYLLKYYGIKAELPPIINTVIDPKGYKNNHLFLKISSLSLVNNKQPSKRVIDTVCNIKKDDTNSIESVIVDATWMQYFLYLLGLQSHEENSKNPEYKKFLNYMAKEQCKPSFPWVFRNHDELLKVMTEIINLFPKLFPKSEIDYDYLYRPWGLKPPTPTPVLAPTSALTKNSTTPVAYSTILANLNKQANAQVKNVNINENSRPHPNL